MHIRCTGGATHGQDCIQNLWRYDRHQAHRGRCRPPWKHAQRTPARQGFRAGLQGPRLCADLGRPGRRPRGAADRDGQPAIPNRQRRQQSREPDPGTPDAQGGRPMAKTAYKTSGDTTGTKLIEGAVVRHESPRSARLLDKAFALAFKGLVYAQIWEDPVADMEALRIGPDSRIITIARGGCNALSYLTADPAAITVVDLNTAHIAPN